MIRCRTWLSATRRNSTPSIGLALFAATSSTAALAQSVTQTLSVNFSGPAPIPIATWTAVAIAVLLAVVGAVLLRRRSPTGAWFWSAALLGTGALLALQSIRSADAIIPVTSLNLTTSPAMVQFTFPGAPAETEVLVTNDTGGATKILSITLDSGPYVLVALANPCTVGLTLGAGKNCTIGLLVPP
jgi:hypothetical protein